MTERLVPYAVLTLNEDERAYLDKMMFQGGHKTRRDHLRALVREIIRDDRAAEEDSTE